MLSRRAVLASSVAALAVPASARPIDLVYAAGRLTWPGGEARAACGRGGVRTDKREGDGASPAGSFPLLRLYYRPDRLKWPPTGLPVTPLEANHGWVDDPADPNYNRLVTLPYPAHHEEMWRADGLYDLVVLIGYNTDPPVPGRGSAIFLHVARANFSSTDGCIAVSREVLLTLVSQLGSGSKITIRA